MAPDPLANLYRRWSFYTYAVDNPIKFIDPNERSTESVHVDKYGTVLKNIEDGDNHVFGHDDATTTADADKIYSAKNTSAGGKDIGEPGKTIDITTIGDNIFARDGAIASQLSAAEWVSKVLLYGESDPRIPSTTLHSKMKEPGIAGDFPG